MKRTSAVQTAFQILLGLVLCLLILSASVTVTQQFRPLYYADIHYLNIPETSGLTEAVIRENYDAVIDFNRPFSQGRLDSLPSLAMSESGRIHFAEVKVIFDFFSYMALITCVLSVLGILWSRRVKRFLYLKVAALLCILLPAAAGILVAANWDFAFVAFHKIAFHNDFWIFDAVEDPIITILPDTYFLHCAVMILALVLLGSLLCGLIYWAKNKKINGALP